MFQESGYFGDFVYLWFFEYKVIGICSYSFFPLDSANEAEETSWYTSLTLVTRLFTYRSTKKEYDIKIPQWLLNGGQR